ncbi:hypothetical protein HUX88_28550 [Duganella sp. BJB1802]|uniref:hypothetical protein n=1 Tax=unclassified Duganella TaxID=2636909 RepID=UPI0011C15A13|nr:MULTISPECIES: hypothetical protein [unclassified Duganella]NVD74438.1 hypothetical protein [Duganella sp. BJB1802]
MAKAVPVICLIALGLLAGCETSNMQKPFGPYVSTLKDGEYVTKDAPNGRFTVLSIRQSGGKGFFGAWHSDYKRLIHNGRIVIEKSDLIEPWPGLDRPAFFVHSNSPLEKEEYLVHETAGKVVVDRIDHGDLEHSDSQRVMTREFPFGYPLRAGARYFPGVSTPGFLLSVFPMKVQVLPAPFNERRDKLWIQSLASISPDQKSFAYVDSLDEPSSLLVADDNGESRDALPIPIVSLPREPDPKVNPYERVRAWFDQSYTWQRNAEGKWDIVPIAPVAPEHRNTANPLEEIFLTEAGGYRNCFITAHKGCASGWRQATAGEMNREFGEDYTPPFVYAPVTPMQAFGANAKLVLLRRVHFSGSGYTLFAESTPEKVVAEISRRLQQRKITFVRVDQCPRGEDNKRSDCDALIKSNLGKQGRNGYGLDEVIHAGETGGTVFVMRNLAVVVLSSKNGGTMIATIFRQDFSRGDPPSAE